MQREREIERERERVKRKRGKKRKREREKELQRETDTQINLALLNIVMALQRKSENRRGGALLRKNLAEDCRSGNLDEVQVHS